MIKKYNKITTFVLVTMFTLVIAITGTAQQANAGSVGRDLCTSSYPYDAFCYSAPYGLYKENSGVLYVSNFLENDEAVYAEYPDNPYKSEDKVSLYVEIKEINECTFFATRDSNPTHVAITPSGKLLGPWDVPCDKIYQDFQLGLSQRWRLIPLDMKSILENAKQYPDIYTIARTSKSVIDNNSFIFETIRTAEQQYIDLTNSDLISSLNIDGRYSYLEETNYYIDIKRINGVLNIKHDTEDFFYPVSYYDHLYFLGYSYDGTVILTTEYWQSDKYYENVNRPEHVFSPNLH